MGKHDVIHKTGARHHVVLASDEERITYVRPLLPSTKKFVEFGQVFFLNKRADRQTQIQTRSWKYYTSLLETK